MTLLSVENLGVTFHGNATVRAVDGVSFSVGKGEVFALVGESGSGKTTAALALPRLLPPAPGCHVSGAVRLDGVDLLACSENDLLAVRGGRIGFVFQEPQSALNPLHPVHRQVAECLKLHQSLSPSHIDAEVNNLFRRVGLDALAERRPVYPHQLSGGQRQRVVIAMAIANRPDLLIADEPTTALDAQVARHILDLLDTLRRESGMAILLITHDLPLVRRIADRVGVMQRGALVECASRTTLFGAPTHPYTRALLASEPKGAPPALPADSPLLLEASDVSVRVPGPRVGVFGRRTGVPLLENVGLFLRAGETLGIVGESGSGKTTLAHALLRLRKSQGVVWFDGGNFSALPSATLRAERRKIQVVFQDPFASLNPRFSVAELVAEGLRVHPPCPSPTQEAARVAELLDAVGLPAEYASRYPHELSGGQRQRVAIARALALDPKLIVLDEPTSALDVSIQTQILDLLRRLQSERGFSYLFITHDLRVIRVMAHRLLVLQAGKVVEAGTTETVLTTPHHPYTRALIEAAFPRAA